MELSIYDYIVVVIVLLISAAIGVYYRFTGDKQKTIQEYLLANGQMSAWPVAFSLMASFMSAITLLGVSSENYMYGTQYMVINLSYLIGTPIVTNVYLPVFYRLRATSVYEYLFHRFGNTTRLVASMAFSIQMVLYSGIVLFAPALALSAVTGLNKELAVVSIGIVCTFYSTIGGMKAVLLTDVFQSILMFAAIYCVIIKGCVDLGGLLNILSVAQEGGRIEFFNMELDPTVRHTIWTQLLGGLFIFLPLYAVNQAQVQRLLTVRSLKDSQNSLWISFPIMLFLSCSTAIAGLIMYANYRHCDPLLQGRICSRDQLLPLYVIESLGHLPGIPGLFIAGLLSGSLSTISSAINSLAAVTWEDYISPFLKETPSALTVTFLNKILAFTYGLLCIGLAFLASQFKGILQASLTVFGIIGGPLLGLFTLGMMFPFVSEKSAVPSFVVSIIFGIWMGFGLPKPPVPKLPSDVSECPKLEFDFNHCSSHTGNSTASAVMPHAGYFYLYRISYMWYSLIGFSLTVFLACLLSLWFPQKGKVRSILLSPIVGRIMANQIVKTIQNENDVVELNSTETIKNG